MNWTHYAMRIRHRFRGLLDPSAWGVILLCVGLVALYDRPMAVTLLQWTPFGMALTGVTIMLSRVAFPDVNLLEMLDLARHGNQAAAKVVLGIMLFMAATFLGLVLWSRA